MPNVSITMITRNRAEYLPAAIDSILAQTYKDWELIVVDDASEDSTDKLINDVYKIRIQNLVFIRNEFRQGIGKSRNIALAKASGKYIAVLDSDDVWSDPDKLKKQVEFLENNPDYVVVGCNAEIIDQKGKIEGRIIYPKDDKKIRNIFLLKNQFVHSSVLYRKEDAQKLGGYNDSLVVGEDYDLFLKIGLIGKLANLSDVMVKYRHHKGNICLEERKQAFIDNITIINRYKNKYPGYLRALFRRYVRYFVYRILHWK